MHLSDDGFITEHLATAAATAAIPAQQRVQGVNTEFAFLLRFAFSCFFC